MNDKELVLQAIHDSRNQFYGKAKVRQEGKKRILKSYDTDVASIENGKVKVKGMFSLTTTRHIKEFLKQQGIKADTGKQILKDYGDDF